MNVLEITLNNMVSPAILFFLLGVIAITLKSDLEIPDSIGTTITLYILIAIGLRGGIAVSHIGIREVLLYALAAVLIGVLTTSFVYAVMSRLGFDSAQAGSIAGHFGACSSVTLTSAVVFLQQMNAPFEEFVPALYPFMDIAALITAIFLGYRGLKKRSAYFESTDNSLLDIFRISLTAKSTILIFGGFIIGLVAGVEGTKSIMPFYDGVFRGIFTIFMIDIGLLTGSRLYELKGVKPITFLIAMIMPVIHATIAITLATLIGLSVGGATIFAALAAGASYITAPAVMRDTFPQANPSLALAMSLGIVFPLNIIFGIPLYYQIASMMSNLV